MRKEDSEEKLYDGWHFYTFETARDYSDENPLYSFMGSVEDRGEVVLFDKPPKNGAFHSPYPDYNGKDPILPTESFENAIVKILTNPNKEQDITDLLEGMYSWEREFLDVLVSTVNENPNHLPKGIRQFINACIEGKLNFDFEPKNNSIK